MSRRFLGKALLFLIPSLLLSLPAAAAGGPVIYSGTVGLDDYGWIRQADGAYRIEFDGSRTLGVTDQADLPVRNLLLLVPADLAVTDVVIEPVSTRRESLPGPLAVAAPLLASNGDPVAQRRLEPRDGVFPPSWGEFGGLHTWRGFRLLAVTVHPFRVIASDDAIEVLERFTVRAVVDPSLQVEHPLERQRQVPGERPVLDATLRRVVDNPTAVGSYARRDGAILAKAGSPHLPSPTPSLDGSGVRYLIITTEALAGEFQRLADHRTAIGLPAKVVTREWIDANYRQGIDFQETMRLFLQDAYARWGLEFLLIGGDVTLVPTRFVRSNFFPYNGHTDVPTDLYFAGLDGNWAADGDGWLGEPYIDAADPGDSADFAADIDVARAPVRDVIAAQNFVDKILAYELATPSADYANRILFAAEVLFPDPWHPGEPITLDGATYAENLIANAIEPCTDMESLRMYETDQSYPYDARLTRAALIDSLDTGHYGQVDQFGHGHFFNMSVGDANFTVSDAANLTNGPNYFLLFALNCASGAFDVSSLLEAFVENPHGGSVMSVGAAREAFPSNTFGYQSRFYDVMACDGVSRAVASFNAAKLAVIGNTLRNTVDRWTQLNAVVIGDPATSIWNGNPRVPDLVAPGSLAVGEQQVVIQVTQGGSRVAGADVCIRKDDETYDRAVTDGAGNAFLTVIPATGGVAQLTVAGSNLAVTTATIPVTGSASYLSVTDIVCDDSAANGNGVPEAGEIVELHVTFEDVGGAGATGLAAVLTTENDELVILDGDATMADVAPGGTTTTVSPFVVRIVENARDGQIAVLRVATTGNGGEEWVSEEILVLLAPEPSIERMDFDDTPYGNGNGVPESGERLVIHPIIKNFGAGRVDQFLVELVEAQPGVTVHGSFGVYGAIELLEESSYTSGELSVTLADINVVDACRLQFTDNYGRTLSQSVEFNPPAAPTAPVPDATVAPDAIALRWDPAEGGRRILGYNVYRAESEGGVFVRANPDLLRGISYFEDRGLDQLTPYWYKVTALDTFLAESDFSPVVGQGTMPAELENFPLPFQVQTSSHSAVGDVDGDGDLEIVLASDEIYVWNHDGSEILDGDNDSQTTGPLTGVDGQFEPAGVVLAEIDGEPGLEIVASERANARQIHIYKADGTMLPGWPRTLQSSYNWAAPSVGDVDGDGDNEIVVNDTAGRTFVWHHDGTELVDGDNNPATDGVFVVRNEGWAYCSPALFDLDGDGADDIILGTRYFDDSNTLLAYRHDGTQVAGFPFATGYGAIICSAAVADLDRDGDHEIIFFTVNRELYVLHHDGVPYQGFPITFASNFDDSAGPSPGVGNFDADRDYEIVWPVNGGGERMDLVLVDTGIGDGTAGDIMAGWPVELPCNSEGSPVVGDINGDGIADIVQPVGNSDTETPDLVFAFNADGTSMAGFPIRLDGHCRATPVICDVDGDDTVDVVYASWDRLVHVWDMPFPYNPGLVPWPTFQGDMQRTGVARQVSVTPVEDDQVPQAFTVVPPFPNPFNPVTHVRLYVAPGGDTQLDVAVFDLRGRRVRRLHTGQATPGWMELTWDGRDDSGRGQASGIYFVRARQAAEAHTFKLTLVK